MALHVCSGSGSPIGSVVPLKLSQHYTDTFNNHTWISYGLTVNDWVEVGSGTFSGPSQSIAEKSADYTATLNDYTILVDSSGADKTITLPTAIGNSEKIYNIKKIDSSVNSVFIEANASETIDNELNVQIKKQFTSITVQSDGSNWWIL